MEHLTKNQIIELLDITITDGPIKDHLKNVDGVMIGRAIYQNPYFLVDIEKEIFKVNNHPSREQIAEYSSAAQSRTGRIAGRGPLE